MQRRHRRLSRFRNPKHLGKLTTFADLNAYQRLDLKLMRFYDRPVWQRVLIGTACVPLVPFVLLWHSPKAGERDIHAYYAATDSRRYNRL